MLCIGACSCCIRGLLPLHGGLFSMYGGLQPLHWKACSRCICRRTRQICCCRYMEDMLSLLPLYSDAAISVSWRAHARRVIHCAHEGHPRMLRCRSFMPAALTPSQFSLAGDRSQLLSAGLIPRATLHPRSVGEERGARDAIEQCLCR